MTYVFVDMDWNRKSESYIEKLKKFRTFFDKLDSIFLKFNKTYLSIYSSFLFIFIIFIIRQKLKIWKFQAKQNRDERFQTKLNSIIHLNLLINSDD